MKAAHGEAVLAELSDLVLQVDSGQKYSFSIEDETGIAGDDIEQLLEQQRTSPARQAFWGAMSEKILALVRQEERKLAVMEGVATAKCREWMQENREGELIAESAVIAAVSCEKPIQQQRRLVDELKYQYGLVRVVRDAVERRGPALNQIVDRIVSKGG